MKTMFLFLSLITTTNAFAKDAKKAHKKAKAPVTIIDMTGPAEPESPLPEIAKKGSL
jgi:hypothetical protein